MTRTLPLPPAAARTARADTALDHLEALYARIDDALARLDRHDGDRNGPADRP